MLDAYFSIRVGIMGYLDISSDDNPWPRTNGRISFVEIFILFSVPSHNPFEKVDILPAELKFINADTIHQETEFQLSF
ncbi:hypothetical protein VNO80_02960 [Phaseolus coccineus]|uniref:Uncharacterized protein n=1 Tax=Phaseolus coccineus TaxID=3886 RepID=A0AAN9NQF0_PHACN